MSITINAADESAHIELDYDELEDLEWALSIAAHQMTKRARDARREPEHRANINDAREAFCDLQDRFGEARMELDAADLVAEMEEMEAMEDEN